MKPTAKEADYELEERAAVREFDGGHQPVHAKILAQQDMLDRRKERQFTARQETELCPAEFCEGQPEHESDTPSDSRPKERRPLPGHCDGSEIERLIDQREKIRRSIKATDDPQRVKELIVQWQDLCRQIISL